MTDSLLKEVDNALRWQRVQELWQRAGKQIMLFVSLAVISLIALLLYQQHQDSLAQQQSDWLLKRMTNPEAPTDMSTLSGVFAQMGHLIDAREQWQAGNRPESEAALTLAQETPQGDVLLSRYACLMQQWAFGKESAACTGNPDAFADLKLEPRLLRALSEEGAEAAYALMPPEAPDGVKTAEPARLSMLRAYLRSRTDAQAQPVTNAPKDEASDDTATTP